MQRNFGQPSFFKLIQSSCFVVMLILLTSGTGCASEPSYNRRVMTWVPPYAIATCQKRMSESFDGIGMKDGITHVGLQFWHPTNEGGVQLVSRFKGVSEAAVSAFRQWGHAHGVRVMLCIYNGAASGWHWESASSAFDTHRAPFIDALVRETVRLKLDGVDIDFEGKGGQNASKAAFLLFIKELSARLHAEGKELTIDSFAYKWNAPNQRWWAELLPYVDGLHVMGYSETGAGAAGWQSYDFIKAAGGEHASKLLIGVPSHKGAWLKNPMMKHLRWVADDPEVGLAIWDAQLRDPAWRTKETWQTIAKIKGR